MENKFAKNRSKEFTYNDGFIRELHCKWDVKEFTYARIFGKLIFGSVSDLESPYSIPNTFGVWTKKLLVEFYPFRLETIF